MPFKQGSAGRTMQTMLGYFASRVPTETRASQIANESIAFQQSRISQETQLQP